MKSMKKTLSLLLSIIMIVSLFTIVPLTANAAETITDTLLENGFESTDSTEGWTYDSWSARTESINMGGTNHIFSAKTGSAFGWLNTENTGTRELVTPVFDMTGASSVTISFSYANGSTTAGQLCVYLMSGDTQVTRLLRTTYRNRSSWQNFSTRINYSASSPAPENTYLVFKPENTTSYTGNVILDDIKVVKTTQKYTVTLNQNGGTGGTESVEATANYLLPDITVPVYPGYEFGGYRCDTHNSLYYDSEGKGIRNFGHNSDSTLNAVWTLIPAVAPTVEIPSDEIDCTYGSIDGDFVAVEATADEGAEYTLTYQWYDEDDAAIEGATEATYEFPSDLEAGSYTYYCIVTATRNDNSDAVSVTSDAITVNVDKATPDLTVEGDQTLVYNGKEQALISDSTTTGRDEDVRYNLDGGDYGTEIPSATNAGTYVVGFKSLESDNYYGVDEDTVSVTIEKAIPEYTVPTGLTATYGETLGDIDISAYPGWTWKKSADTSVGNAGNRTFAMVFTPDDTDNYKTVTKNVTVSVAKVNLTVTAKNQTIIYGDALAQNQYTVKGLVGSDKVKVTLAYSASTNVIKPTVTNCSNYNVKTVNGIVTIKLSPIASAQLSGKNVNLKWSTVKNADGYLVYAGYCGSGNYPLIKTITNNTTTSLTIKKLNGKALDMKDSVYMYVVAYKNVNGKKLTLVRSVSVHVAGSAMRFTNAKSIKVNPTSITLKVKKTATVKHLVTMVDPSKLQLRCAKFVTYVSSNKSVATVSANGKITAVGKGTANIYAYTPNGTKAKVAVTVK